MAGRLIAVVGPSGVGKDSVISGIVKAEPSIRVVRRTITREPDPDGENHQAVTQDAFEQAVQQGAFCLHWFAHGLRYGIPAKALDNVLAGEILVANLSRNALTAAHRLFPKVIVLNIKADANTLAARLKDRGREDATDIASRLDRASMPLPEELEVFNIHNDGPLELTIKNALRVIDTLKCA